MRELRSRLVVFSAQAHDQAVSKSVEQKPEIIPGQILSGPEFNVSVLLTPSSGWEEDLRGVEECRM